jgi:hypothetical protein
MTEEEWLAASDPTPMLHAFRASGFRSTDRKFRLFAVACCRRVWHHLIDGRSRAAVEATELLVEGHATQEQRREGYTAAGEAYQETIREAGFDSPAARAAFAAWSAAAEPMPHLLEYSLIDAATLAAVGAAEASGRAGTERAVQAKLCRDVFCNPFRPVIADPSWLTSIVVALAAGIYEDRAFDRLPILADALQDAGCDHADILNHCRGGGVHVRGCWMVDLLTGRG